MPKLKVTPINLDGAKDIKTLTKTINDVTEFQVSVATNINRIVSELNSILPALASPYNDSELRKEIAELAKKARYYDDTAIRKKVADLAKSVKAIKPYDDAPLVDKMTKKLTSIKPYDDAPLVDKVGELAESVKAIKPYDDVPLVDKVAELSKTLGEVATTIKSLRADIDGVQKEVASNRKEAGLKIDIVEQRFNKLTKAFGGE